MAEPGLVALGVRAMRGATALPVTVKCRIGIDDSEEWGFLARFVETVAAAGCATYIVHARKAWLNGLSPKENREIPPLRYEVVQRLKAEFPELTVILNGGITDTATALANLPEVDGLMIGRGAYQNPWWLTELEPAIMGKGAPPPGREQVVAAMAAYAERRAAEGVPLKAIARHVLGLAHGLPGARAFRRCLGEGMLRPGASPRLLVHALMTLGSPERRAA
jgi:tRNA-dihydrouridine synthase A